MSAPQNVRDFSTGLFDCCANCSTCLCGCFCPERLASRSANRLGESGCCVGCCMAPTSWIALRTKLRTMYGINGSIVNDYFAVLCCASCFLCQMDRELDHIGL